MTTITAFIKRHPLLTYFALTFALSWGGILWVVGPTGGPGSGQELERLFPIALLLIISGPSVAGILLTAIIDGRNGLRSLFSRMVRWRVGVRWYALALLTTPLVAATILFALSLTSPDFRPGILATDDMTALLLLGVTAGLVAGFFEEIGWTGFALPRVRLRYGVLVAGIEIGLLWGAWHFLVDFWAYAGSYGAFFLSYLFLFRVLALPAFRVLIVWVSDRTGSLLLAMLTHASFAASLLILSPPAVSGGALVLWHALFATALWVVVGIVAVANGGHLSRQPLRRTVA